MCVQWGRTPLPPKAKGIAEMNMRVLLQHKFLLLVFWFVCLALVFALRRYQLLFIDGEARFILVRWVEVPMQHEKSLVVRIRNLFETPAESAFRDVVYGYSQRHEEVEMSKNGEIFLYSGLDRDWGESGAPGRFGVHLKLRSAKIISYFQANENAIKIDDLRTDQPRLIYAWTGNTTSYYKLTARLPRKGRDGNDKGGELKLQSSSWIESHFSLLRDDDVFIIFDKEGFFVRYPGSWIFKGYKWWFCTAYNAVCAIPKK